MWFQVAGAVSVDFSQMKSLSEVAITWLAPHSSPFSPMALLGQVRGYKRYLLGEAQHQKALFLILLISFLTVLFSI